MAVVMNSRTANNKQTKKLFTLKTGIICVHFCSDLLDILTTLATLSVCTDIVSFNGFCVAF